MRERHGVLCDVFLFSIWQEASSQQALRDPLSLHESIRISAEMAEVSAEIKMS